MTAPLFARTFAHATASALGAYTLSINAYHLPPLTPLTSAGRAESAHLRHDMRSVHTEDSAPAIVRRASARHAEGVLRHDA